MLEGVGIGCTMSKSGFTGGKCCIQGRLHRTLSAVCRWDVFLPARLQGQTRLGQERNEEMTDTWIESWSDGLGSWTEKAQSFRSSVCLLCRVEQEGRVIT